jgi:hypothetical protein
MIIENRIMEWRYRKLLCFNCTVCNLNKIVLVAILDTIFRTHQKQTQIKVI